MSYRFTLTQPASHADPTRHVAGITLAAICALGTGLMVACGDHSPRTAEASLPSQHVAAAPSTPPVAAPAPAPETPVGHVTLGRTAWHAGDRDGAAREFRRALELDSSQVKVRLDLSRVLLEKGDAKGALVEIRGALGQDSTAGSAYRLLGRAHDVLGHTDSSVAAYRKAIVLNDQDAWAMNNLALVYIERGQYAEALKPLARAVELGTLPAFRNNLGLALERTGHYAAAAESYRAALTADTGYTKASVNLTRVSTLTDQPSAGTVDLAALALEFMRDIEGWKQGPAAQQP